MNTHRQVNTEHTIGFTFLNSPLDSLPKENTFVYSCQSSQCKQTIVLMFVCLRIKSTSLLDGTQLG